MTVQVVRVIDPKIRKKYQADSRWQEVQWTTLARDSYSCAVTCAALSQVTRGQEIGMNEEEE